MRNPTLHGLLESFAMDCAARLTLATANGDEIPFEVVESADSSRARATPLYCYRPLTRDFVRQRLGMLVALPTYAAAARALEAAEATEAYLLVAGESRISDHPRDRADAALRCFLDRLFADRSELSFDADRFAIAYAELERALYQGHCVFEVAAPILGLALAPTTRELELGDGLSIARPEALPEPPVDAKPALASQDVDLPAHADGLLLVLRLVQDRSERPPVWQARTRFRRVLTALRLFEHGGFALAPIGYTRIDDGAWKPVPLGGSGRPRLATLIPAEHEDEFRAFCNLISRRMPSPGATASGAGELAWALARFEMGCERLSAFEALTDYLLALRALLEPEGPTSGRLAQRLSVICASADQRTSLAERTAQAIALERAVITGIAPPLDPVQPAAGLVDEMAGHLRAILRDTLCGHLDADVRALADELLAEAATSPSRSS